MKFRFQIRYHLLRILHCSHEEADSFCRNGQIEINNEIVTDSRKVIGNQEEIRLSGKVIREGVKLKYLLFYKPNSLECSTNREIKDTIYEVLPDEYQSLFSLGRLDKNSEGLLLLTNDGKVYKELMDLEAGIEKEYMVFTHSPISQKLKDSFTNPFQLGKRMTLPAYFEMIDPYCFKVILKEGINRQIRRICAKNENQVKQLVRIRFGEHTLDGLKSGEFREISGF